MNKTIFRLLLLAYMILIISISSIPQQSLPKTFLLTWDKGLHMIEYFLLGILAIKSINGVTFKSVLLVVFFGILFAVMDEYLQSFISGRMSSGFDVLADFFGIALGALIFREKKK